MAGVLHEMVDVNNADLQDGDERPESYTVNDADRPVAVGCYIFAGGFTIGVSKHFKIRAHLEAGSYGVATFKRNFPRVPVWKSPSTWPLKQLARENIDFVYGNPPCAAWSPAGATVQKGGNNWWTDPRVNCTRKLFEVLEQVRPKVWAWESVPQAATRGRPLVKKLTDKALEMGYAVTYLFTKGHFHGIPQPRRRFMMFCHDIELDLALHSRPCPITLGEKLGLRPDGTQDCPVWGAHYVSPDQERFFNAMRPGESFRNLGEFLDDGMRHGFMFFRLRADSYGATFTSCMCHVHPTQPRWLSDSEMGRLCGWPDDYVWEGPDIRAQMAQAVLPPVGDFTGERVAAAIRNNQPIEPTVRTVDHDKELR